MIEHESKEGLVIVNKFGGENAIIELPKLSMKDDNTVSKVEQKKLFKFSGGATLSIPFRFVNKKMIFQMLRLWKEDVGKKSAQTDIGHKIDELYPVREKGNMNYFIYGRSINGRAGSKKKRKIMKKGK